MFPYPMLTNELQDLVVKSIPLNTIPIVILVNKTLRNQQLLHGFARKIDSVLIKSDSIVYSRKRNNSFHVKLNDRLWFHIWNESISLAFDGKKLTLEGLSKHNFWTIFNKISTIRRLQIIFEKSIIDEQYSLVKILLPRVNSLSELEIRAPFPVSEALFKRFNPEVVDWLALDLRCQVSPQGQTLLHSIFSKPTTKNCRRIGWTGKQFPWMILPLISSPMVFWTFQTQSRERLEDFIRNLRQQAVNLNKQQTIIIHLFGHHFEECADFRQHVHQLFDDLNERGEIDECDDDSEEFWIEIENQLKEVNIFGNRPLEWRQSTIITAIYKQQISPETELLYAYGLVEVTKFSIDHLRLFVKKRKISEKLIINSL